MYDTYAGGGSNFWFWFWFGVVLQAIVCGGLSAGLASAKNRDKVVWFLAGFFFGIFGLIAAAGMPVDNKISSNDQATSRRCDQESPKVELGVGVQASLSDTDGKFCRKCNKAFKIDSHIRKLGSEYYHFECLVNDM